MIKVVYTIASKIGSSGLGNVSRYAIKVLQENNFLIEAIAYGNLTNLEKIVIIPFNPFKPLSFLSKKSYYPLKKSFFDFITSMILRVYDFNVLHTWLNQSLLSMKTAKKKGARIILECGSTHPKFRNSLLNEEYIRLGLKKFYKNSKKEMERALREIEMADFILTPSEFARKTFIQNNIPPQKVIVIPRGVNTEKFFPQSKNGEIIRVIFAGHIGIRKGVHHLLDAWRGLKTSVKAELILIGNVQDDFREIVKKYHSIKNVSFVGFTRELWKYFNSGHIFVFPTIEEGSAKVIYEAMASGMAVITTENAGSIIENKRDGIIVPIRDAESIRKAIEFLLEDAETRNILANNAVNKVRHYTWDNYSENLLSFYKKISWN